MKTITQFLLESSLNLRELEPQVMDKFDAEEDFFINTSYNEKVFKPFLMHIGKKYKFDGGILFLDLTKAEPEDLGGIQIKSEEEALPHWAKVLVDNSNKKYIFVIDLSNTSNSVMNALMPIVLNHEVCGKKLDNYIIAAFGDSSKLVKPLKSRFKPIIEV